jgi:hypothetical protein
MKKIGIALIVICIVCTIAFTGVSCKAATTTTAATTYETMLKVTETTMPPTVESLELDDSLLSNSETLAEKWINERTTEWYNAGATPENAKAAFDSNIGLADYAKIIAKLYDKTFIDALLIKDWESNPVLVEWVNNMTLIHWQTLALYFATSPYGGVHPGDKEPYMRGSEYTQIISSSINNQDGSVIIVDTEHSYDNADLNRVGEDLTYNRTISYDDVKPSRTFVSVDGKIKLSDVIFASSQ